VRRYGPVVAVVGLALVVIAGLVVAPVRTYFRQEEQGRQGEAELQQLRAQVGELDAELQQLRTDAEVERIARQHYDLVFPGEESYRILPAPDPGAPPAEAAGSQDDSGDPTPEPGTGATPPDAPAAATAADSEGDGP
jgi:cell division protein FtsB